MNVRQLIGIIATTLVLGLSLALLRSPEIAPTDPAPSTNRTASAARFYPGSEDVPASPTQVRAQEGAESSGPAIVPAVVRTRETRQPSDPQPEPWA